jgi:hypothetical protein
MKFPIIALAGMLSFCAPAHAQMLCAPYENLRNTFNAQGIRLEGGGSMGDGRMEIWLAPNDDWAMIAISPEGIACMMTSGENWTSPERL